jgi:hypothetical protein
LAWDHVPFAAGYKVYLSTNGVDFSLYSGVTPVPTNNTIITEVENDKPYFVGVSAVGSSGVETAVSYPGGAPDAMPIIPKPVAPEDFLGVPPAPPKNLQGFAGDQLVHLEWDANTEPDLKDYIVSFSIGTPVGFSAFPAITVNEYDHNDALNGVEYFYKVQARDEELLVSGDSNIVRYTPQSAVPLAPTGFTAIWAFVEGGVILDWDLPPETDIIAYRIIRYDITTGDDDIDPMLDTSIVTILYPKTKDPYDPDPDAYIWVPPFVDRLVDHGHIYRYELAAIDVELQIGASTLSNDVEVPE